jgi:hypothetical protein
MSDSTPCSPEGRRKVLGLCGAGLLALAAESGRADEHAGHHGGAKGIPGVVIDASREGICGTCRFWGGTRRISEDGKSVVGESLGWCNNRESPHFLGMRAPDAGPMKNWRKWEALQA